MSVKQELIKVIHKLSDDEARTVLSFAEWLRDSEDRFTKKELAILIKGEKQIQNGDVIYWRNIKRN